MTFQKKKKKKFLETINQTHLYYVGLTVNKFEKWFLSFLFFGNWKDINL